MPELPETETMARQISQRAKGLVLGRAVIRHLKPLGGHTLAEIVKRTEGYHIVSAERRAKVVAIELDSTDRIVMHPKMTGAVLLTDEEPKYGIIGWPLNDGRQLWYADMRRFGTVKIMSAQEWVARKNEFGPEPLDRQFGSEEFRAQMAKTNRSLKAALMDPALMAGVGNIYAAEALWSCGLYPGRKAKSLTKDEAKVLLKAIKRILRSAIKAGGTSKRDYIDVGGQKGSYALKLKVYGRHGQPCERCFGTLVASGEFDNRTTVWCPGCQKEKGPGKARAKNKVQVAKSKGGRPKKDSKRGKR